MGQFLYEIKEGFFIAMRAIRSNKVRSILTMLGIVIGVTSVVAMSTAIKGIDKAFQNGVSALGSDVLYVDKWAWFSNTDWWKIRARKNLTMDDYNKFRALAKLPIAIAPTLWTVQTVKYEEQSIQSVFCTGSTAEYVKTTNFTFSHGRFFTEVESNSARYVVVIGSDVAKNLFPRGDGLDKTIKISGVDYKIVGILDEIGSFIMGSMNPDKQVFIPIGTVFKHFLGSNKRSITINVRAPKPTMVQETKEETEAIMRQVRGIKFGEESNFSINQQEGLQKNFDQTVGVIQIAGLFITGLSLFVGAIGIMNIMFVSVKERTKEIGIRKAIGATRRSILGQFILESSFICLFGGLIGLILAIILSKIVNNILPTSIQYDAVLLAIGISLLTGVIAGFAPAYTAAKMDPVEALRYE
jgi:putative ABC transport system permease protein